MNHAAPPEDPKALVRAGYDALSLRYCPDDAEVGQYGPWIARLLDRLPARGRVLDLGCGCGVPVARELSRKHDVTGVDLSDIQIARARGLVPAATFLRADAALLDFGVETFDAVVCTYMLIHLPLDEQPGLVARIASWLTAGGWFLAIVGHGWWTGTEERWLGGDAPMWWSHADAATYRSWIVAAGLEVVAEEFVPEGESGHVLFWARRPGP